MRNLKIGECAHRERSYHNIRTVDDAKANAHNCWRCDIFFRRVDKPVRDHSGGNQSSDENTVPDSNEPLLGFMKFEWSLLAFSIGICMYYAWPSEVVWWSGLLVFSGLSLTYFFAPAETHLREYLLLTLCLVAGFGRSVLHTQSAATPILPTYERTYEVSGWVENMKSSGPLQHFYIRVHEINNLPIDKTPYRVRVRLKPYGFVAGDTIALKAVLAAPKAPVLSGGYDPARAAYFRKIGGYGFAISKPTHPELGALTRMERAKRALVRFRYQLSRKIQARAPPKTAGLQAALLTGDRSAIPRDQEQALRDAGLAHLLAISGLHMGLLAGGVYSLASLLFAMITPLSRRYDMRKYAAIFGAFTACAYLILSGASVSTQRAFIMALIVFIAVILNRRAVSLRSVALAAALTLIMHPESLISAGFQMSFAATTALVVVYRSWADKRIYTDRRGLIGRIKTGFIGVSVTSLVAGLATAGFAALHFHRFARLGLIANLAAMPVFTLIAMPAGFFALVLMPLGLDIYLFQIMGFGLEYVIMVASWVADKKMAVLYIKGGNGLVMSLFGFGFAGVCFSAYSRQFRPIIASCAVMAAGVFIWSNISRPDMRISDKARIAFWDVDAVNVLRVDRVRGDKFGRSRFVEASGITDAEHLSYYDTIAMCDHQTCRFELKGKFISIVNEPEAVLDACNHSDLVVLTVRKAGVRARKLCKVILLDMEDLSNNGARDIRISEHGIHISKANPERRKNRPWG